MKSKFIILFLIFSFLVTTNISLASTTNGTIDTTYHYAWGENVGWVDFAQVGVTDSSLSGSIYGENIGWIDLSTIINNSQGNLSGYAWGENVGWLDFSQAAIGDDSVFTGSIYGENIGWITFGTDSNKVATDWRPAGVRGSGGGGHVFLPPTPPITPPITPPVTPIPTPQSCITGQLFSPVTGLPCTSFVPKTTEDTPSCLLTITLRQGYRGTQVKCLQTKLHITSDGIFGKNTKNKVITFQKENSLTPDGIVGPITRIKLNLSR